MSKMHDRLKEILEQEQEVERPLGPKPEHYHELKTTLDGMPHIIMPRHFGQEYATDETSQFKTPSPEAVEKFHQALLEDPKLIGKLLTWAVENGIMLLPDESLDGLTTEELLVQLREDELASQMEDELLDQQRQEEDNED